MTDLPSAMPEPQRIQLSDIAMVLRLGLRDFLRAPAFGLFFSAFYVAGGLVLWQVYAAAGQIWWLMPFVLGFPLLAPFAAVGLYDVSRRLETENVLDWPSVLRVVFAQKDRQVPSMGVVILLIFMVWVIVAHTIYAVFMGLSAMTEPTLANLMQGNGPLMLLVGSVVGAGFAGILFSATVIGLPILLDREIDFISAIILSIRVVAVNLLPLAAWGAVIAALLFLAMVPMFLGLFVVMPVLGHATWHMYRRLIPAATRRDQN